jgi:DNA polymerase-3 subunit delta'
MRRIDDRLLTIMDGPYPWQEAQWTRCLQRVQDDTLPHALLLCGQAGLGKLDFARRLALLLLCERCGKPACGTCKGCRFFRAGNHPDYLEVGAEEDAQQIKIDQIRALNEFICLSRQRARHKVAVIAQAELMNRNAANSLLKNLEEPPSFSLIALVTSRPSLLAPTLLSRCQRLAFTPPRRDAAVRWLSQEAPGAKAETLLSLANEAPLTALATYRAGGLEAMRSVLADLRQVIDARESTVSVAQRWRQYSFDQLLAWLLSLLAKLAKLRCESASDRLIYPDIDQHLRAMAERIDFKSLFSLYDSMLVHRHSQHESLSPLLSLEDILLAWHRAFRSP